MRLHAIGTGDKDKLIKGICEWHKTNIRTDSLEMADVRGDIQEYIQGLTFQF